MTPSTGEPCFGGVRYSTERGVLVRADGEPVHLRRQSLEVFRRLASRPDAVVTKDELFAAVWDGVEVTDDSLVQCVAEIRRALGDTGREILRTVPRRGYTLVPDPDPGVPADGPAPAEAAADVPERLPPPDRGARAAPVRRRVYGGLAGAALVAMLAVAVHTRDAPGVAAAREAAPVSGSVRTAAADDAPTLLVRTVDVAVAPGTAASLARAGALLAEVRVALSRYRTVRLVDAPDADFTLALDASGLGESGGRVTLELADRSDGSILLARGHDAGSAPGAIRDLGVRIAAAVASPGVGAVSERLLERSRLKPIEEVTRAECYANGFGCVKCSGEEDNITARAEACLAHLIERDPEDARAWALQATIHAHQYLWANTLPEPLRSDPKLRAHIPRLAVEAADRAESLSDGRDSAIYWGMAEAYFASCQPDKLAVAVERGLAINPDDPNLMGAFGNWLSYSGRWDEGAALVRRAIEIEPVHHPRWWWMGPAKAHYVRGEFEQAYELFLKAFEERNWLSHLQLAYTLPHLGRMDEARAAVRNLLNHHPGITLELALETYERMCFPDSFLVDMKDALVAAGLGSRGDSSDFDSFVLPRAEIVEVDGHDVEYLDVGEGEPVVFVHGAISDYRTWGFYLLPISERHRFITYSRRYYGTQPWTDDGERYSQTTYASDLVGFIEALELGPVHLVSWSSGVRSALLAMADRPELFKSAVHYEPVETSIFEDDASIAAAWNAERALWGPVFEALAAGDAERAGQRMLETVFELELGGYHDERELHQEIVRQNARTLPLALGRRPPQDPAMTCDWLTRIRTPTRIVVGGDTREYWTRMAERYAECIPGATLEIIPGTDHSGAIDRVDEMVAIITRFVDAHR